MMLLVPPHSQEWLSLLVPSVPQKSCMMWLVPSCRLEWLTWLVSTIPKQLCFLLVPFRRLEWLALHTTTTTKKLCMLLHVPSRRLEWLLRLAPTIPTEWRMMMLVPLCRLVWLLLLVKPCPKKLCMLMRVPLGVADADRRDHPDDALHDWPAPGMPFLRRSDLLQLRGCSTNRARCVDDLLQRAAERQHDDRGFSPLGVASEAPARFCSNVPPAPLASSRLSPLSLPPIPAFPAFQRTHEYTSALRVSGPALPAARESLVRLSTTTAHVWK
ncbi:unnamed protein product [Prorocentrum cordatum]|uniref:F-box domain-containing protein n=1 Tax=Prorocentrum cordatum TaxID=2364126 RepID=A0ABN9U0W2_9DINO|nr:unnamed protein product [Polarella glacialis]